MAGGQERILRRRIKSVQSTKKITRAMELIAASRIVKAQARVQAAQPYADGITDVVRNLQAAGGGSNSPLLAPRAGDRARSAKSCIAADRGLCGGYNSTVIRAAEDDIARSSAQGRETAIVTVGRKAEGYFRFRDYPIDAAFAGFSDRPHLRRRARRSRPRSSGRSKRASSTSCSSSTRGSSPPAARKSWSSRCCRCEPPRSTPARRRRVVGEHGEPSASYEFEPEPEAILDALLPRYAEARIYAALLERGRVGARGPPARDEGRDRQRRRPDPHAQPAS